MGLQQIKKSEINCHRNFMQIRCNKKDLVLQKHFCMYSDTRKINIIEAVLKVKDEKVLNEVESVLAKSGKEKISAGKSFVDFTRSFTKEEADEFEKLIEEGCEKINEDDWK